MPLPPAGAEPDAWLALDLIPGLGPGCLRRLLAQFGSPSNVLAQPHACLANLVGEKLASSICTGPDATSLSKALQWLGESGNHLLTLADDDYPADLLQTADPPLVLYLKGRRELLNAVGIAVVGSRNATPGGTQNAEAFSRTLSEAGLTIISGLAMGIDAAAHRGGLFGKGSSIAVVGTGLDLVYPSRNKSLAHELALHGLMISEFPLGTPAIAANFPRRNRIISGLSKGVLVVEAALASGSLITARLAGEQGRDVFAIPGSIHSPLSKGCHQLIKQGAKLVDEAQDILIELALAGAQNPDAGSPISPPNVDQGPFLNAIGYDPITVDAIVAVTGFPIDEVLGQLTAFELDGLIASLPGGKYQRLN
jgi:DNA processing protein